MWKRKKFIKRRTGTPFKFIFFVCLMALILLSFAVLTNKLFVIKNIEITSGQLKCADENKVKDLSGLLGKSLLFIDRNITEEKIKNNYSCIKSVTFSQKFPNAASLYLLERQALARVISIKDKEASLSSVLVKIASPAAQNIEGSYIIDDEGIIFGKGSTDLNIPKIYIFNTNVVVGKSLEGNSIFNFLSILAKVKTFGIDIGEGWVLGNSLVVRGGDALNVIFDLNDEINIQLASLQLILDKAKIDSSRLEFIDLRFDKPIIRFTPKN